MKIYFGHHKCATTWTRRIIQEICKVLRLDYMNVSSGRRNCDYDGNLGAFLQKTRRKVPDFLAVANSYWSGLGEMPSFRAFHMIRDPRDIIVSGYYTHLLRSDHLERKAILEELSLHEGLKFEIRDRWWQFGNMEAWPYDEYPNILEVKFEEMVVDPPTFFRKVLGFIGLGISPTLLDKILERNSFERLTGRQRGEEVPDDWLAPGTNVNALRRGSPGDWVNYFTDEHIRSFNERYPKLLERLGYD